MEVLDIIKANIRVLADALSVEFASESTVLVFEQAVGETRSWSVAVDGVTIPAVNGVAEVIVERDTEVDYQILVEGGADVSGSLIAMGPNLGIQLERFEPVDSEYTVTITSTTPGAVVMINGVAGTTLTVDAGSTVTWEVSAGDDWVAQSGTIESISANYTQAVTLVTAWSYEVPQVNLSYAATAPVTGGTVSPTLSYTQVAHNVNTGDSTITTGGVVTYTISQQAAATVAQSGDVTFVSAGTAIETAPATATVTATVTLNGQTGRATASVSRVANTIQSVALSASATEVTPVFSGVVPAGGATGSYHIIGTLLSGAVVSVPGLSVSSVESWASFADGTYTISSRGTEVGGERTSALSISVAASQAQAQAEVSWSGEVSQEANAAIYAAPVVSAFTYAEVPAAGGTATPSALAYSQAVSYTSGASGEAITGDLASPAAGVDITYSAESHPINTNSGEFSVVGLGTVVTEVKVIDTVSVTVALNGVSGEASAEVSQAANTVSYSEPVVSLSYADIIPASGGSVSPTLSYTQTATYASGDSSEISEGGSVTYAGSVVNSETGDVSAASLETTESEQKTVDTVTATVVLNGQSGSSAGVPVYQAANVATYGDSVEVTGFAYPASAIPAAGGSASPEAGLTYSLSVSYTSGASSTITSGGTVSYSSPIDWGELDSESGEVTAASRGTEVGDANTAQVTVQVSVPAGDGSVSGSAEATVTQEANAAVYADPVVSLSYASDIPANGGSVNPTLSYTQEVTYTSGETSDITSGGEVSYSGTSVDPSSGAVTGADLSTTAKERSVVDTVTASVSLNGKAGTSSAVEVYQAANVATYGESVVISGFAYPSSAIAAAGGSQSPEGGMTYSLSVSYTSGASSSITEGGVVSYASSIDWGSVDPESGEVTAASRGTTAGEANTAQVTATVTISGVGSDGSISGSAEATVTQEANTASYAVPVIVKGSYEEFPAEGATKTPSATTYTQQVTYASGSTEEVTGGATITYSMDSTDGFTLDSTETGQLTAAAQEPGQPTRSVNVKVTVSVNGQSASDTIVASQAAGAAAE